MVEINHKYDYAGYMDGVSDAEFLGWIYARLNSVFGEAPKLDYMKRLEEFIDDLKDKEFLRGIQWTQEEIERKRKRKREIKMTRDEARKIVFNNSKELEGRESGYLVDALEALGLIKFDEPEKEVFTRSEAVKICRGSYLGTEDFIAGLEKHGYKIVSKD